MSYKNYKYPYISTSYGDVYPHAIINWMYLDNNHEKNRKSKYPYYTFRVRGGRNPCAEIYL